MERQHHLSVVSETEIARLRDEFLDAMRTRTVTYVAASLKNVASSLRTDTEALKTCPFRGPVDQQVCGGSGVSSLGFV